MYTQIAVTLSQLSVAYYDLGQPHRSIELLERALDINKNAHGPAHISVAITTSNMSTAYRHLGEVTKSKELAEEALKMTEDLHGPAHPGIYGSKIEYVIHRYSGYVFCMVGELSRSFFQTLTCKILHLIQNPILYPTQTPPLSCD